MLLNGRYPGGSVSELTSHDHNYYQQPQKMGYSDVTKAIGHNPAAEISAYGNRKPGVIPLYQGETGDTTPQFITDAVINALQAGKTGYAPPAGVPELRQALSNYYQSIYNHDLPMERMIVTSSGTSAVDVALTSVCNKGDEIVAVTPVWKNLLSSILLQEGKINEVPLDDMGDSWELNLNKLFESVTAKTKALIINTPNNPTGWIMPEDDMRHVMNFARERGLWVLSDEVYGRMVFDEKRAPSFLDVSEPDDNLIVMNSFSKNYSMTGWRLGWLVTPEGSEKKFQDINSYKCLCSPTFSQFAAIAALENGEQYISERMNWYKQTRNMVHDRFTQMGNIHAIKPEATFYSFFKVDGEPDDMKLARKLIDKGGLGLAPGCSFGCTGEGYLRICTSGSYDTLNEALNRLEYTLKPKNNCNYQLSSLQISGITPKSAFG